jgi:AcrR family transcriptional regulator
MNASRANPSPRTRVPQHERRTQLLDVTLALLVEEGFDKVSVEAIARRTGVNRVVVYRSFANLQVLLVALLRREQKRVERQLDMVLPGDPGGKHPRQILLDTLAAFLDAVESAPLTWHLALAAPEGAPVALRKVVARRRSAIERRLRPLIAWGLTGVRVPAGALDDEVVSRMILSLGEEHGRLLLRGGSFTRERLIASAERVLAAVPWSEDR